jgi:hypothetical protein
MSVTFEQSLEDVYDWIEYQRSQRKRSFPLRSIVLLVIIAYGFLQREQTVLAWALLFLALCLATEPLLAPWQKATWRRRVELAQKADASGKVPEALRSPKTIALEERGLRVADASIQREVLHYWESLQKVIELERLVVVQLGRESLVFETLLIPRRAFATLELYAAFVAELRGKLPAGEAKETPSREP